MLINKICLIVFFVTSTLYTSNALAIDVQVTARVTGCGDNIVDSNEQCDGNPVTHNSCTNLGFSSGNLVCTNACNYNTSSCSVSTNNNQTSTGQGLTTQEYFRQQATVLLGNLTRLKLPKNSVIFEGITEPETEVVLSDSRGVVSRVVSGTDGKYAVSAVNLRSRDSVFTVASGKESKRFIVSMYSDSVVKYNGVSLRNRIKVIIEEIINEYEIKWKVSLFKNKTRIINE